MALNAQLADLTSRLITSITQSPTTSVRTAKALKSLKEHNYARVNQFAITSRLDGLDEKFIVLGREDLAQALKSRLVKLPNGDKFLPDKLALLLALSDRPHEHVLSDVIDGLSAKPVDTPTELTWDEIVKDDPLDEPDLWDDVEHGYHSSGDEEVRDESDHDSSTNTDGTSTSESPESLARLHLIDAKTDEYATKSERNSSTASLTEYDLFRETLFVLRGLRNNVYDLESPNTSSRVRPVKFSTNTSRSLRTLLDEFAELATQLHLLSTWSWTPQPVAYVASCQHEVQKLLRAYHEEVSLTEEQIVRGTDSRVISLLQLLVATRSRTEPLVALSKVVRRSTRSTTKTPIFLLLDNLFEVVCHTRSIGHHAVYDVLASVLFSAITTYLRPVEFWCQTGQLMRHNKDFFVVEAVPNCEKSEAWTRQYALRPDNDFHPSAPSFMIKHMDFVFACGKQKMFASLLREDEVFDESSPPSNIDIGAQCRREDSNSLVDFSQILEHALSKWLESFTQTAESSPTRSLINDHGLLQALDAYEQLYLCKDSMRFGDFSRKLFRYLERLPRSTLQADPFVLTEMLREVASTSRHIDPDRLSITFANATGSFPNQDLTTRLKHVHLQYIVPWPLVSIFQSHTPEIYIQTWILLTQAQRAQTILHRHPTIIRTIDRRSARLSTILHFRFHLLAFTDALVSHITMTCRELHRALTERIVKASAVDDMIALWRSHCDDVATGALISPSLTTVRDAIDDIFILCEGVGVKWTALAKSAGTSSDKSAAGNGGQLNDSIERYRRNLDTAIDTLHDTGRASAQHEHLLNLAAKLELCRYHK